MFDPNTFMNTTLEGSNSTDYVNVPEMEGLPAQVEKVEGREITTKDGPRVVLDVTWSITDEKVAEVTRRAKNTARQSVFLDMNPGGGLDMSPGANVQLGRLRAALRQNDPLKPWAPNMMVGQFAKITTKHRLDERQNRTYVDVVAVVPF